MHIIPWLFALIMGSVSMAVGVNPAPETRIAIQAVYYEKEEGNTRQFDAGEATAIDAAVMACDPKKSRYPLDRHDSTVNKCLFAPIRMCTIKCFTSFLV